MRRGSGILTFALASLTMLAIAVLVTRPFVDSWGHALLYGLPLCTAMQLFGFWDRRRVARELEKRCGRLTVRGSVLIFEEHPGKVSSVDAAAMRKLWYQYSIYGWSGANNWSLVYEVEQASKAINIYECGERRLLEPLRAWCIRYLPGFDQATFDRLVWSLGDDDQPSVLVWSREDP
jgi:hypothetical protein